MKGKDEEDEEDDSDEEKILPGDPKEKEKLLEKREELVALLRSIRHSLEANEHPVIEDEPLKGSDSKGSWLWWPRHNYFSPRGVEKSRELFERFAIRTDSDGRIIDWRATRETSGSSSNGVGGGVDQKGPASMVESRGAGADSSMPDAGEAEVAMLEASEQPELRQTMDYFAFRGYLQAVGRPFELEPHIIESQEAWRCYMFDLFGTEPDGSLNAKQFEAYRAYIEPRFPLEKDLLTVGISVAPAKLVEWKRINTVFDKLAAENITDEELYALRRDGIEYIPKIPVEQLQLLAYDAGELLTQSHCEWLELMHFNHNGMMAEVRHYYKSRNQFAWHQETAVNCEDRTAVYRDSSAAWWFSNRPRQMLRFTEEKLLAFKLFCIRGTRNFMLGFDHYLGKVQTAIERGLLMSSIFNRLKQDTGRYTAKVEVGDADAEDSEGMTANLTFSYIDQPARSFSSAGLPPGIGSAVLLDLLVRDGISRVIVTDCINKLDKLIGAHFGKELSRLGNFHSHKVFSHLHETDAVPVIRIALMLKPESSIDFKLRQLNLGVKVSEMLIDLNVSAHLSTPITEILEAKKYVVNESLTGGLNGTLVVARRVLSKIVEEFQYSEEEKVLNYNVENDERKTLYETAFSRTRDAVLSKFSGEARDRKAASLKEMTVTGYVAGKKAQTDEEIKFFARKSRQVRSMIWSAINYLKGAKTTTTEIRFESVSELFFSNVWVRSQLPSWLTRDLLETPGAPARAWKHMLVNMRNIIARHWKRVTNHEKLQVVWVEQAARDAEDAENRLSKKERARLKFLEEKRALAEKLKGLGIEVDDDIGGPESNVDRPVDYLRECKNKQIKNERNILEAYKATWSAVCSVHSLQAQCGSNRITLGFQGFDIFEVLPEPPENPPCVVPKTAEEEEEERAMAERTRAQLAKEETEEGAAAAGEEQEAKGKGESESGFRSGG